MVASMKQMLKWHLLPRGNRLLLDDKALQLKCLFCHIFLMDMPVPNGATGEPQCVKW
jgi:hypothetical protein